MIELEGIGPSLHLFQIMIIIIIIITSIIVIYIYTYDMYILKLCVDKLGGPGRLLGWPHSPHSKWTWWWPLESLQLKYFS